MENKIEIGTSGVSITIFKQDGKEDVHYYPTEVSSKDIVHDSTTASGIELIPEDEMKMVEAVDYTKTHPPYISEAEVSFNFKEGFKARIKREPAKIIRYVSK